MALVEFLYFDAGGGHRSAATALCEVIAREQLPWETRMVNLQEILDPIDIVRKLTGVRIQDTYNAILKKGWTLGSPQLLKVLQGVVRIYHDDEVRLIREHFTGSRPDLVVSMIPHFNRAVFESLAAIGEIPFVTILTDIADYPPHFWLECQDQYVICGSQMAVQQAKNTGVPAEKIFSTSGMIVHPRFYDSTSVNRGERKKLGLDPSLPTGLVMFGGLGSEEMYDIARRMDKSDLDVQFIFICGHNKNLAEKLRHAPRRKPAFVEGFTREVPYYMSLSDFFIGKPGPGSISEALLMQLPVIVQRNALTLPQERYNTDWVQEKKVGMVVSSFSQIEATVRELLQPATLQQYRSNAAALQNRAIFEIPKILASILSATAPTSRIRHGAIKALTA